MWRLRLTLKKLLQTACLAVMCSVPDDWVTKQLDVFECERRKIILFHVMVPKNDSASLNYLLCKHMDLNGILPFFEFFRSAVKLLHLFMSIGWESMIFTINITIKDLEDKCISISVYIFTIDWAAKRDI